MTGDAKFEDAKFEDGKLQDASSDRPLRLRAETAADLRVLAALAQDAVGRVGEAAYLRRRQRFVALLSRFRWEDAEAARRVGRPYERVRATLGVAHVLAARARGRDLAAAGTVYNLLDVTFAPGADGTGVVTLALSGGGDIALDVEALDVTLTDVARPHAARGEPRHGD